MFEGRIASENRPISICCRGIIRKQDWEDRSVLLQNDTVTSWIKMRILIFDFYETHFSSLLLLVLSDTFYLTLPSYTHLSLSLPAPFDESLPDRRQANKLWLLPYRSPPPLRNNAKWMLCCAPHPLANCYGGMPSHASDLYHTMNASSAAQRGHK